MSLMALNHICSLPCLRLNLRPKHAFLETSTAYKPISFPGPFFFLSRGVMASIPAFNLARTLYVQIFPSCYFMSTTMIFTFPAFMRIDWVRRSVYIGVLKSNVSLNNLSWLFLIETNYRLRLFDRYRIYSNKRRGAYLIFLATSATLIRGRRLFKNCTRQIYFFYIQFLFNGTLSFYLLIFLWTDNKMIVNLELHSKNSERRAYRPSREIVTLN